MRHFILIAVVTAVFFSNCRKEQIIVRTPNPIDLIDTSKHIIESGRGFVVKNGSEWAATFKTSYHYETKKRFFLKVALNYTDGLKEVFAIEDVPIKVGKHFVECVRQISDLSNFVPNAFYTMSNYDEGIGNFYPDTTRTDNFIEVLYCDTIKNEVEGRFQVFMIEPGGPSTLPGVPDSVFLTEGKFYLKLQ